MERGAPLTLGPIEDRMDRIRCLGFTLGRAKKRKARLKGRHGSSFRDEGKHDGLRNVNAGGSPRMVFKKEPLRVNGSGNSERERTIILFLVSIRWGGEACKGFKS